MEDSAGEDPEEAVQREGSEYERGDMKSMAKKIYLSFDRYLFYPKNGDFGYYNGGRT